MLPESLRNSDKRRNGPDFPNDTKKRKVDDKDSSHYVRNRSIACVSANFAFAFFIFVIYCFASFCLFKSIYMEAIIVLTDCLSLQDSDGEKSDDNLVVDVSNEVSMF